MYIFPKEKTKLQARIRQYERSLLAEEKKFGGFMDSSGKRYLLGPLYLLADDLKGALRSFHWFQEKFPDDVGEPFHYLCWTLALLKSGSIVLAKRKLLETVLSNQYVVPILLGREIERFDMYHSSNDEEPEWVNDGPVELFELWDKDSLAWAAEAYDNPVFMKLRTRHVEIFHLLDGESDIKRRKALLTDARKLAQAAL